MRGRKPKATAEHQEAGTFRKDRHAKAAAPRDPLKKLPKAPAWLTPEAAAKWADAGTQLVAAEILTVLDLDALAGYCEAWSTWRKALAELVDGLTYANERGEPRKHPAAAIAEAAQKACMALQERLGLTPLARQRIRCEPGGAEKDALTAFMDGQ